MIGFGKLALRSLATCSEAYAVHSAEQSVVAVAELSLFDSRTVASKDDQEKRLVQPGQTAEDKGLEIAWWS